MKKIILSTIILTMMLIGSNVHGQRVVIKHNNTKKVIKVKPNKVKKNYIWVEGHWKWSFRKHRYVWVKGHWKRKKKHHVWIP